MAELDPTILPRRVLERQARMHQWLQHVGGLTAAERQLAAWLINCGDGHGDTIKDYETIAELNGASSARTARRAAKSLSEKGLVTLERRITPTGPTSNRLRLRVPAELFELRLSESDMQAGADPLDADLDFVPAGTANLARRINKQPANLDVAKLAGRDHPSKNGSSEPDSRPANLDVAKLADEPSYNVENESLGEEVQVRKVVEGSPAKLAGRPPRPFAGKPRDSRRQPRSAADVFGALAAQEAVQ